MGAAPRGDLPALQPTGHDACKIRAHSCPSVVFQRMNTASRSAIPACQPLNKPHPARPESHISKAETHPPRTSPAFWRMRLRGAVGAPAKARVWLPPAHPTPAFWRMRLRGAVGALAKARVWLSRPHTQPPHSGECAYTEPQARLPKRGLCSRRHTQPPHSGECAYPPPQARLPSAGLDLRDARHHRLAAAATVAAGASPWQQAPRGKSPAVSPPPAADPRTTPAPPPAPARAPPPAPPAAPAVRRRGAASRRGCGFRGRAGLMAPRPAACPPAAIPGGPAWR